MEKREQQKEYIAKMVGKIEYDVEQNKNNEYGVDTQEEVVRWLNLCKRDVIEVTKHIVGMVCILERELPGARGVEVEEQRINEIDAYIKQYERLLVYEEQYIEDIEKKKKIAGIVDRVSVQERVLEGIRINKIRQKNLIDYEVGMLYEGLHPLMRVK